MIGYESKTKRRFALKNTVSDGFQVKRLPEKLTIGVFTYSVDA
jgi:hypothetical protein